MLHEGDFGKRKVGSERSFPQRISGSNFIFQKRKLDAATEVAGGEEAPTAVADLMDDVGKTYAETLIVNQRRHVSCVVFP